MKFRTPPLSLSLGMYGLEHGTGGYFTGYLYEGEIHELIRHDTLHDSDIVVLHFRDKPSHPGFKRIVITEDFYRLQDMYELMDFFGAARPGPIWVRAVHYVTGGPYDTSRG